MPFLSSQSLKDLIVSKNLVRPYRPSHIKHGAYELAFGSEAYITTNDEKTRFTHHHPSQQVVVDSGQFGILLSEEKVEIPNNYIGFISIRSKYKQRGLINVSGFHVDPGYSGRLKFAVYNAGSRAITLSRGDRAFPLWFAELDEPTDDPYNKNQQGNNHLTSSDINNIRGNLASPSENKLRIDNLNGRLNALIGIATGILASILILLLRSALS